MRLNGRAEWQRRSVHYFTVPKTAGALEFDLTLTQGEKVSFTLHGPDGEAHAAEVSPRSETGSALPIVEHGPNTDVVFGRR